MNLRGGIFLILVLSGLTLQAKVKCDAVFKTKPTEIVVPTKGYLRADVYRQALDYLAEKHIYFESDALAAEFYKQNDFVAVRKLEILLRLSPENFHENPVVVPLVLYMNTTGHNSILIEAVKIFSTRIIDDIERIRGGFLGIKQTSTSEVEYFSVEDVGKSKYPTSQTAFEFVTDPSTQWVSTKKTRNLN